MYKVFFNQKPIILTTSFVAQTDRTPGLFHVKFTSKKNIIAALKSKKVSTLYLYHPREERLMELFLGLFKIIEAAGGIVDSTVLLESICSFSAMTNGTCQKGVSKKMKPFVMRPFVKLEEETGSRRVLRSSNPCPRPFMFSIGTGSTV